MAVGFTVANILQKIRAKELCHNQTARGRPATLPTFMAAQQKKWPAQPTQQCRADHAGQNV